MAHLAHYQRSNPVLAWAVGLLLSGIEVALAQPLPDVTIVLTADIRDTDVWLGFQDEVVVTPGDGTKSLVVSVPAKTGGRRSITVTSPEFTAKISAAAGSPSVKVTVTGKIGGMHAVRALTPFQQAVLEMQSGIVENEVRLSYGVSEVSGHLIEVKVTAP